MKFNGRLGIIIPGNFISWDIINLPGPEFKQVVIPEDYDVTGALEAASPLGLEVYKNGLGYFPTVMGSGKLNTAVFEIEKTGRKTFHVIRYIGELKTTTINTIEVSK